MIFVDANVFVYAGEDPAGGSSRLLHAVASEQVKASTSTAAIEELWHLEHRGRPGGLAGRTAHAYALFTPLLAITDAIVARALAISAGPALGTNDRVHAATCLVNGITQIVTADAAFDEIAGLERINPLDSDAVSALLV